ncbi:MAG: hypothetical protein ACTSUB_08340 [Candidatus Thorarchaeota archaeon]
MNTDKLVEKLCKDLENEIGLPWLDGYTDHGNFRPRGTPRGNVTTNQVGVYLSVSVKINHGGTTSDRTTDRAGGDPYSALVRYDWVGLAEAAPATVSSPEQLDDWSLLKTHYVCENTDSGLWGEHKGSWVKGLKEDGTVTLLDATGRYQDVSPESTATERTVKLEVP